MTNVAPDVVAATLAPLAGLDAEVVLAVDDRVDPAWVEGLRDLADEVVRVAFPGSFGLVYPWLRRQCRGRWLLQLDADEVPSAGLAAEVEEVLARDDVTHAWVPRRWVLPGGERWLDQWPWRPDHSLRLVRNDPAIVRFPMRLHLPVAASGPHVHLRAPILHLDLAMHDLEARRRKVARYEAGRPGLVLDGRGLNDAYYLPEQRDDLRTAPVDPQDRDAVQRFLLAATDGEVPVVPHRRRRPWPRRRPRGTVRHADADAVAAAWPARWDHEAPDAYAAALEVLTPDLRVVVGEGRELEVEVVNRSSGTWPALPGADPQIAVACRWLADDGTPVLESGHVPLAAPVAPGASVRTVARVHGHEPGEHLLEVDLVHEQVRWFGVGVRLRVRVEPSLV